MTPDEYQRLKSVFFAACSEDPASRAALLDRACAGDADLRRAVERLLAEDAQSSAAWDAGELPLAAGDWRKAVADASWDCPPGGLVGGYRILARLGEGGMGVVYLAEQQHPCRQVALKVMRPYLRLASLRRRFEREAELLARLRHPGIAQIYEAGTADTPQGPQPFFAMELVTGRPLLDYARAGRLGVRERIELLRNVCEAVQHAHLKGVIHRDLKPDNILVEDGGRPKVLDFGVARAMESEPPGSVTTTRAGELVGTLAYMSPEQILGDPEDLDARSDVHALGVVGYELLTGRLPYSTGGRSLADRIRAITQTPPVPLGDVDARLRGDLEAVFRKVLHKQREHRYQSAAEFAADLGRFLMAEPVLAQPATRRYQLRMFARRHRRLVAGTLAAAALVLAGSVGLTYLATRLREHAIRLREHAIRRRADDLQHGLEERLGLILGLLDRPAAWKLRHPEKPEEADNYDKYSKQAQEAVEEILTAVLPADLPIQNKVPILWKFGNGFRLRHFYQPADVLLTQAWDMGGKDLPEDDPDRLQLSFTLALLRNYQGRPAEAEDIFVRILPVFRAMLPSAQESTLTVMRTLALARMYLGRLEEARRLAEEAVHLHVEYLGMDSEHTASAYQILGDVLAEMGDLAGAKGQFQTALDIRTRLSDEEAPGTLASRRMLFEAQWPELSADEKKERLGELKDILDARRRAVGERHPTTLDVVDSWAQCQWEVGHVEEARAAWEELLTDARTVLPEDHWRLGLYEMHYADILLQSGETQPARRLLEDAHRILTLRLGSRHRHARRALTLHAQTVAATD